MNIVSGNSVTFNVLAWDGAGTQFTDGALFLPVNLHPYPHLWSQAMGGD